MNNNPNNEKLLKILIAIGIMAILVSVYIQYLKPFIAELSKQKRDQARIENFSLINSALNKLRESNPDNFLGEPNKVYISVPSPNPNCDDLELPSLPDGWEYRCKPETEYRKINGQGWIPVDFAQLPKDFNFESSLPIDPANTADSGYYYAYVVDKENNWVLSSLLKSDKHLKKTASKDGGIDSVRIEIGSNLQLWAKATGLVGYWSFDEGQGEITKDLSENGNNGTLTNIEDANWSNGAVGSYLDFDGNNDFVNFNKDIFDSQTFTISLWAKRKDTSSNCFFRLEKPGASLERIVALLSDTYMLYYRYNGSNVTVTCSPIGAVDEWHHYVFIETTNGCKIYMDNNLIGSSNTPMEINMGHLRGIGTDEGIAFFYGSIDEVKIYNKVLNSNEIKVIYNTSKNLFPVN